MLSLRHSPALIAASLILASASTAEAKPAWSLVYNEMNTGNAIMAVDAIDATHAFAVGVTSQNGNSSPFGAKTENGTTWDKIALPSGYMIAFYTSIAFVDGNVGYLGGMTGKGGRIWKTDSAAAMWTEAVQLSTNDTVMHIQAFPSGQMFAAAGSTMVAFDGTEFTKATPEVPSGLGMTAVRMLNPTCGFAVATRTDGEESALYYTSDGGKTWAARGGTLSATIGKMWFVSPTLGWAAASKGGAGVILKTTDGGSTWVDQPVPPHPKVGNMGQESPATDCFDVRFFDDKRGVAACAACTSGCGGGEGESPSWVSIFVRTEDGGASWTMDPDYEAVMVAPPFGQMAKFSGLFYLAFPDPNNGYLVGTNNLVLRYVAETPEAAGWAQPSCESGAAGSGAGGSGAAGSGPAPGGSLAESSDDSGCGCRTDGRASGAAWLLVGLALAVGIVRRRR